MTSHPKLAPERSPAGLQPAPFYQAMLASLPTVLFVVEMPQAGALPLIVDCNPAACAATGYSREELIGRPVSVVSAIPLDREEQRAGIEQLRRGAPWRFVALRRHRDGSMNSVTVEAALFSFEGRELLVSTELHASSVVAPLAAAQPPSGAGRGGQPRTSEELLRLVLGAGQMGIWELDLATKQVTWAAENQGSGGEPGPHHGYSVHPDDVALVEAAITKAQATRQPTRYAFRAHWPDGSVRWMEALGQITVDATSQAPRLAGVMIDITDQRRAEEALATLNAGLEHRVRERTLDLELTNRALRNEIEDRERAEAGLREQQRFVERVMATTPSQVYVIDLVQQRMIYVSRWFEELGYSPEEIGALGPLPIMALMHPDDAGRLPEILARYALMDDEEVLQSELRLRRRDGRWLWVESRDVIFSRDDDGRPTQILGAANDITARKEAEARLAALLQQLTALNADLGRSSLLLRTIVDSLDDGLALVDRRGAVLMANEALAGLYRTSREQIQGRLWQEICRVTPPLVARTLTRGAPASGKEQITRPDGTTLTVELRTFPLAGPDGSTEQVVLHLVDITARLQFQAVAIQNERLAARSRLAAIVAHEVNSPLQAIQNLLFLAASDSEAERSANLRLIGEEIDRIGGLLHRLLDLNRPGDTEYRPNSMNALVERVLALTDTTLARHHVTVSRELGAELPLVLGRGEHLTQVLLNLVMNALDAMPGGGTLSVRTLARAPHPDDGLPEPPPRRVVAIEVQDTGAGIAPEVLPHIFEPFFTTKANGSGLGLAISSQIVEQHRGRLGVGPRAGGGAFVVVLPAMEAAEG